MVFFSETLDDGEWESHCFSWACSIPSDQVFSLINMIKSLVLYGEESFDAFVLENLDHFIVFDEVLELALFWEVVFLHLNSFWVQAFEQLLSWFLEFLDAVFRMALGHCWNNIAI